MQPKHPAWKDMIGARVLAVILFVIGIGGVIFLPTVLPNPNSWFASLIFFAFCCIHALGFLLESNEHAKKCGSNPRTRATDRYWDAISTKGKNSSDAIMIRDEWRDDEEFQKIADAWDRRIERTIACQRNNAS